MINSEKREKIEIATIFCRENLLECCMDVKRFNETGIIPIGKFMKLVELTKDFVCSNCYRIPVAMEILLQSLIEDKIADFNNHSKMRK